jgi:hypothetical protein
VGLARLSSLAFAFQKSDICLVWGSNWRVVAMLTKKQMEKVARAEGGHLLWTGGLANGYPAAKQGSRTLYVKRLMWEEGHGPVPVGAVVISTCGLRTCIAPEHLGLSTPGRYWSVEEALRRYEMSPQGRSLDEASPS